MNAVKTPGIFFNRALVESSTMKSRILWLLVAVLVIVHQDFWNWHREDLWLGLPAGLTYHIGISLAAAAVWLFACQFLWPDDLAESDAANSLSPSKQGKIP